MKVPLVNISADPKTKLKIETRLKDILDHGRFILGPEVFELEKNLQEFTGAKHAITCSNGTDALLLALLAKGVRPGDYVYTPSFTFSATAEAIALLGAKPLFVDVDEKTFNIDVDKLKQTHRDVNKIGIYPKGLITVDLFGQTCLYDEITRWSKEQDLWLICDSAQSLGAEYNSTSVGNFGDITTTSFYPTKPLGCYGDGGCVFTNDDLTAEKLRSLRVHGEGIDKYDNLRVGLNARLDTFQAAVLVVKLEKFKNDLNERNELAKFYNKNLRGSVESPKIVQGCKSSWAQYTIKLGAEVRNRVKDELAKAGISTCVYYPIPLHMQPAYYEFRGIINNDLTTSEYLAKTVLSLPMGCDHKQAKYVCDTLNNILEKLNNSCEVA